MSAEIIQFPTRPEGPMTERDAMIQAAQLAFSTLFGKSLPRALAEKLADATIAAPLRPQVND